MKQCPHCEAPLASPLPALCPSCGASLGEPARKRVAPSTAGATSAPTTGAALAASEERTLFEGRPAAISGLGELVLTILTVGLAWVYFYARAASRHYRVTSTRIVVETGLFSKRMEQIDLYRVSDYVVDLPFAQRLLGTGNLLVQTSDRTTKEVRLERIRTDVKKLYEELRAATEADKARRGVRTMDTL